MRLLTAGFMRRDPNRFVPFLGDSHVDIESFCKSEVEPMGKECDQPQIIAITECLGMSIEIAYLDGRYSSLSVTLLLINLCI
jgi:ubiquitin thioesterase protein OTUB1